MMKKTMTLMFLLSAILTVSGCRTEYTNLRVIYDDYKYVSQDAYDRGVYFNDETWRKKNIDKWASAELIITDIDNVCYPANDPSAKSLDPIYYIAKAGFNGRFCIKFDPFVVPASWGSYRQETFQRRYYKVIETYDLWLKNQIGDVIEEDGNRFVSPLAFDNQYVVALFDQFFKETTFRGLFNNETVNKYREKVTPNFGYYWFIPDMYHRNPTIFSQYSRYREELDPLEKGYVWESYTDSDKDEFYSSFDSFVHNRKLNNEDKKIQAIMEGDRFIYDTTLYVNGGYIGWFIRNLTPETLSYYNSIKSSILSSSPVVSESNGFIAIAGNTQSAVRLGKYGYFQFVKNLIDNGYYFTPGSDNGQEYFVHSQIDDWWLKGSDSNWNSNQYNTSDYSYINLDDISDIYNVKYTPRFNRMYKSYALLQSPQLFPIASGINNTFIISGEIQNTSPIVASFRIASSDNLGDYYYANSILIYDNEMEVETNQRTGLIYTLQPYESRKFYVKFNPVGYQDLHTHSGFFENYSTKLNISVYADPESNTYSRDTVHYAINSDIGLSSAAPIIFEPNPYWSDPGPLDDWSGPTVAEMETWVSSQHADAPRVRPNDYWYNHSFGVYGVINNPDDLCVVTTDPQTGGVYFTENSERQWHMRDEYMNLERAWAITTGHPDSSYVTAIIDQHGFDTFHPDIETRNGAGSRVFWNPGELGGVSGVDDDENGYIDDFWGWSLTDNSNKLWFEQSYINNNTTAVSNTQHATQIGSLFCAATNNEGWWVGDGSDLNAEPLADGSNDNLTTPDGSDNNKIGGIAAIEWKSKVFSVAAGAEKSSVAGPGLDEYKVADALDYIIGLKNSGVDIKTVNLSWAIEFGRVNRLLYLKLMECESLGIFVSSAIGNRMSGGSLANKVTAVASLSVATSLRNNYTINYDGADYYPTVLYSGYGSGDSSNGWNVSVDQFRPWTTPWGNGNAEIFTLAHNVYGQGLVVIASNQLPAERWFCGQDSLGSTGTLPNNIMVPRLSSSSLLTSGAAGQVTGLANLVYAAAYEHNWGELTPAQVRRMIQRGSTNVDSYNTTNCGGEPCAGGIGSGKIDAYKTLTLWGTVPRDTTLVGNVFISGDIRIPSGVTVSVSQDTSTNIYVALDDIMGARVGYGVFPDKVDIIVEAGGTLNLTSPFIVTVQPWRKDGDSPQPQDWGNIYDYNANSTNQNEPGFFKNPDTELVGNWTWVSESTPAAVPTGLSVTPSAGVNVLDFDDNADADLMGYEIYRGTSTGDLYPYVRVYDASEFNDTNLETGTTYYYAVASIDSLENISAKSSEVSTTAVTKAAPNITGYTGFVTNGNNVSITGTDFGLNPATITIWDNFESGTPSSEWENLSPDVVVSNTNRHIHSSKAASKNYNNSETTSDISFNVSTTSRDWFIQYWWRVDDNWDWGQSSADYLAIGNFLRMRGGSSAEYFTGTLDASVNGSLGVGKFVFTNLTPATEYFDGYYVQNYGTDWQQYQIELHDSDYSTPNGWLKFWSSGVLSEASISDVVLRRFDGTFKAIQTLGYNNTSFSTGDGDNTIYFDDIFVTNSLCRVEIGNNSDYDACTIREVQPVVYNWEDQYISFEVNQGMLPNDSFGYIFVTDFEGTRSNGIQVVVIETTDPVIRGMELISVGNYSQGQTIELTGINFRTNTGSSQVIISDSADYSSITTSDVQPILSWTNDTIQFTLNHPSFDIGEIVYVYVINEESVDSNPYILTVEEEWIPPRPVIQYANGTMSNGEVVSLEGIYFGDTEGTLYIGNNSSYELSTVLEEQTQISTWYDNRLSFVFQSSLFNIGDSAWIHITNPVSAYSTEPGYPITVESAYVPEVPFVVSYPLEISDVDTLLTIGGSGFGFKENSAPIFWSKFDDGVVGTTISETGLTTGSYDTGDCPDLTSYDPTYESSNERYVGDKYMSMPWVQLPVEDQCDLGMLTKKETSCYARVDNISTQKRKLYVYQWYRTNETGNPAFNVKPIWWGGTNYDSLFGYPALYIEGSPTSNEWYYKVEDSFGWDGSSWGENYPTNISGSTPISDLNWDSDTWSMMEIILDEGDPGVSNGSAKVYVDNALQLEHSGQMLTYDEYRTSVSVWSSIKSCDNCSILEPYSEGEVMVSDLYIDDTPSRIMIGDAPTKDSCTKFEIQIPSTWSSGVVEFIPNRGGFDYNTTYYLYVFNDDDVSNASGYPITFVVEPSDPTGDNPDVVSVDVHAVNHGDALVITGTGFETRTATVDIYDTLESGSLSGSWNSTNSLSVTSESRHTNSLKSAYGNINDAGIYAVDVGTASANWFCQYWFRGGDNFELSRIYDANLSNVTLFDMKSLVANDEEFKVSYSAIQAIFLSTLGADPLLTYRMDGITTQPSYWFETGTWDQQLADSQWHLLQFEYKESSALGEPDGSFRFWIDGELTADFGTLLTREDNDILKRPYILGFGNNVNSSGASNNDFYIDEMFAASSIARVELGDNPIYNSCTHRELQTITSWADTSIEIEINRGSFANGDYYLFVTDEEGLTNTVGYQISIPGSDTVPPTAREVDNSYCACIDESHQIIQFIPSEDVYVTYRYKSGDFNFVNRQFKPWSTTVYRGGDVGMIDIYASASPNLKLCFEFKLKDMAGNESPVYRTSFTYSFEGLCDYEFDPPSKEP